MDHDSTAVLLGITFMGMDRGRDSVREEKRREEKRREEKRREREKEGVKLLKS